MSDTQPVSAPTAEEIANSIPDFSPDDDAQSEKDEQHEQVEQAEPQQDDKSKSESKEEQKSLIKKLKLKVDGEEFEEEFDLGNEQALIKELQLARAAKKRMAEAQEAKRKAYEVMQAVDGDLTGFLKKHPKGKEVAEQLLLEELQEQMLTPEQRQIKQMERELATYKEMEKKIKDQEEQAQLAALEKQQAEIIQKTIIDALSMTNLPKTTESAKRVAFLMHKNLELGIELDAHDLAQEVKKEYQENFRTLTKEATAEQLLEILDPESLKKLRDYENSKYKARQKLVGTKTPSQSHALPPQSKERGYQTLEEWQEELNAKMRKK